MNVQYSSICPLLLDQLRKMLDNAAKTPAVTSPLFIPRLRTATISSEERSPIEQLAQAYTSKRVPQNIEYVYNLRFDLPLVITSAVAAVVDKQDPFQRLPHGGLNLFRFKIERSNGDMLTLGADKRGSLGSTFFGNGARPGIISNG